MFFQLPPGETAPESGISGPFRAEAVSVWWGFTKNRFRSCTRIPTGRTLNTHGYEHSMEDYVASADGIENKHMLS
jgi:hypothetical protein